VTGLFEDHLSLDAVVAFADGEMSLTAYQRAAAHISHCVSCAADVSEQTAASEYLRHARMPTMPGSLFDVLKAIPVALPTAGPVHGVAIDPRSGRVVRATEQGPGRSRRFRLGAGALVTGIAMGAVVVTGGGDQQGATPVRRIGPEHAAASTTPTAVRPRVFDVVARSSSTSGR
jgi:anti-sigma factor RsiW